MDACDDGCRQVDNDQWIFAAMAPHMDGSISFNGEDGHEWRWDFVGGKLEEIQSGRVFGVDMEAPSVIQKIVSLIYPEHLDGRPITTHWDYADPEYEALMIKIEELLRGNGFGPQAGKSELDRLAEAAE